MSAASQTQSGSKVAPRRGVVNFAIPFALFFALSSLWALASPIFSSPDENAHSTKAIAVVRGELLGERRDGVRHLVVELPDSYRYSPTIVCFAHESEIAANCGAELGIASGTDWFDTWVSTYNPSYYALVGWPTLFLDGSAGIYGMRLVSALLCSLLLAGAVLAGLSSTQARWMPLGIAFLASPMVVYLAGSVTPQGVEVAAGAALWAALIRLLERVHAPERIGLSARPLWIIVTIAAVLLSVVRSLGPLWVVVILVASVALVGLSSARVLFTTARNYVYIGTIAVAVLFSGGWTLGVGTLGGQADAADAPLVGGSFLSGAWATLRLTPQYFKQAAGFFGWLDTELPDLTYSLFFGVLLLLVSLAALGTTRRAAITVGAFLGAAIVIPVVLQGYSAQQTGLIWQGRYGLVLYLGIVIAAAWILSSRAGDRLRFLSVRFTVLGAVLLGVFQAIAYLVTLRRYVVGTDDPITSMITAPEWQPPLGWFALVALYGIAVAGFAAWVIVVARRAAAVSPDRA